MYVIALNLMFDLGLRRGELLGLKWDCVNLEEKFVFINEQITKSPSGGKPKQKSVKAKSFRTLPISDEMVQMLKQLEHRGEWVFGTKNGTPLNPRNWSRSFERWCENAGIEYSSHDLRHTFATDMINSGVDYKMVQAFTGHATTRMLLDNYAHKVSEGQRQALQKRKLKVIQ